MSQPITVALILEPQPEGGFTVTSPILPGMVSEGNSVEESLENAWDALLALLAAYHEVGRPLPLGLPLTPSRNAVRFDHLIAA
jgi:antitoxin HicB